MSLLAKYEIRARTMKIEELTFALRDINESLTGLSDLGLNDPYIQKLYAEWDAYVVEVQKRRKDFNYNEEKA